MSLTLLRTHGLRHAKSVLDAFKRAEKSVLSEYLFGEDNKNNFDEIARELQLNIFDRVEEKTIHHFEFGF